MRFAAGLYTNQSNIAVFDEGVEDANRVAAAADAGHDDVWEAAGLFEHLPARFPANHRLELADHQWIGMRSQRRSQKVVRVSHVGDPVAHRLVDRILQRLAARIDLANARAEQLHPEDIGRLTTHVFGAHVDMTFQTEERAGARGRDAVLTGTGLGNNASLAHAFGEQRLPKCVVDLVRAGVREVFTFEKDANRDLLMLPRTALPRRRASPVRRSASAIDRAQR